MNRKLTRRQFMRYSAAAGLGGLISTGGCQRNSLRERPVKRPHIVMFISDDHGIEYLGCYGNPDIQTPNIDALARDGMKFTNMYAASATCAPSRSVLWTGLYPAHNGCMKNHTVCRSDIKALPSYLRTRGYRVVLVNKFHAKPKEVFDFEYVKATLPRNPAHRRRYRREGLDTKAVERLLADHVQNQGDSPLCLIMADSSPHVTWEPNKIYDPATLKLPPSIVDTPITRKAMANYFQDITTMDKNVGAVRAMLEKNGIAEDTLFIYTTDQGAEWPKAKWTLYDSGIHVPFLAVWPRVIPGGTVCNALASFVDITPTFIDTAGGQPPAGLDGKSFLPVLLGRTKTFREAIYASHTADGTMNVFPQRCVRNARYKYILNLKPENRWTTHFTKVPGIPESHKNVWDSWVEKGKADPQAARLVQLIERHPAEELYDTRNDPYELNNLAATAEMKSTVEHLRAQLKDWLVTQGESFPDHLNTG